MTHTARGCCGGWKKDLKAYLKVWYRTLLVSIKPNDLFFSQPCSQETLNRDLPAIKISQHLELSLILSLVICCWWPAGTAQCLHPREPDYSTAAVVPRAPNFQSHCKPQDTQKDRKTRSSTCIAFNGSFGLLFPYVFNLLSIPVSATQGNIRGPPVTAVYKAA